jgi:two-component sensor histidine kinase
MTRTERSHSVGIFLIFFVVTSFLVGLNVLANRRQAIEAAASLAMTQIQLIEGSIDSLLVVTGLTLENIAGAGERGMSLEQALRDEFLLVNHVSNAGIYDAGGTLMSTLRAVDRPPAALAERVASPTPPEDSSPITAVSINAVGDPIIVVVRTLEDGRTIFAVVSASYISRLFHLTLGRTVDALLLTRDGTILARWSPDDDSGRERFLASVAQSNRTLLVDGSDSTVFARMQLASHPFHVALTFGPDVVLSQWRDSLPLQAGSLAALHVAAALVLYQLERRRRQAALARERSTIVRETNHRVKNNLAVLDSVLSLMTADTDDDHVARAFADLRGRIASISLIHDMLYREDSLDGISFDEYCRALIGEMEATSGYRRLTASVTLDVAPVILDPDAARRFGLIIHELVTNAWKYAGGAGGGAAPIQAGAEVLAIQLVFRADEKGWSLTVSDNGPGFPDADSDAVGTPGATGEDGRSGVGTTIIDALGGENGALVERWNDRGAHVRISGTGSVLIKNYSE